VMGTLAVLQSQIQSSDLMLQLEEVRNLNISFTLEKTGKAKNPNVWGREWRRVRRDWPGFISGRWPGVVVHHGVVSKRTYEGQRLLNTSKLERTAGVGWPWGRRCESCERWRCWNKRLLWRETWKHIWGHVVRVGAW